MQDLTPQLRTRLSRVERAVGVFVLLATALLLAGFGWYLYKTGERKGWFVTKVRYGTSLFSAAGLKVGDPVKLMGFDVGEITLIEGQDPSEFFNVYVEFDIHAPYFGYLCTEGSRVRVSPADFLGKRLVEVTKGTNYVPTHLVWDIREYTVAEAQAFVTNVNKLLVEAVRNPDSLTNRDAPRWLTLAQTDAEVLRKAAEAGYSRIRVADRANFTKSELKVRPVTAVWSLEKRQYVPYHPSQKAYWLEPDEAPALTDRIEAIVRDTETALTNQLVPLLANANAALAQTQPLLSNVTVITANLRDPDGSLGRWALPPDLYAQVLAATTNANVTLLSANTALTNTTTVLTNTSALLTAANTNVAAMVAQLDAPLRQLSTIISNLNLQVSANTNFVTTLHTLLIDTDDLIQGFKRHWFLRGAFRTKPTNAPPAAVPGRRYTSPKDGGRR